MDNPIPVATPPASLVVHGLPVDEGLGAFEESGTSLT